MSREKLAFGQPVSPHGPWMAPPFTVEMTPTAAVKRAGAFSSPLSIGLLRRLPDPDGVGAVELDSRRYMRQLIDLTPCRPGYLAIPRPVLFQIHPESSVVGVGLFTDEDVLEAYGVLRSSRISWRQPDRFEFASHQILVKRPGKSV